MGLLIGPETSPLKDHAFLLRHSGWEGRVKLKPSRIGYWCSPFVLRPILLYVCISHQMTPDSSGVLGMWYHNNAQPMVYKMQLYRLTSFLWHFYMWPDHAPQWSTPPPASIILPFIFCPHKLFWGIIYTPDKNILRITLPGGALNTPVL